MNNCIQFIACRSLRFFYIIGRKREKITFCMSLLIRRENNCFFSTGFIQIYRILCPFKRTTLCRRIPGLGIVFLNRQFFPDWLLIGRKGGCLTGNDLKRIQLLVQTVAFRCFCFLHIISTGFQFCLICFAAFVCCQRSYLFCTVAVFVYGIYRTCQ